MMNNPLQDIENRKANEDLGRMAVQVFVGAKQEASSWSEAFWATFAFFVSCLKSQSNEENETF